MVVFWRAAVLFPRQDPQGEEELDAPMRRERLMEAAWPGMAYGESGEPEPSLIPYQVTPRFDFSIGCNVALMLFISDGY